MNNLSIFLLLVVLASCKPSAGPSISPIAHAGGGIHNKRYTNTIEAMDLNLEKGFSLFEIDFIWTSDGEIVCLHDWDRTPKWLLGYEGEVALSLKEFQALKNEQFDMKPCDIYSLSTWVQQNPNTYIVTDFKGKNLKGHQVMKEVINDAHSRIIPQFTQPEQYAELKKMGYQHLIWTLYSFKGKNQSVIDHSKDMDLFAITMPPHKAKQGLAKAIKPLGIPTYVHTINDTEEALDYQKTWGLTSVYTDFLPIDFDAQNQ